MNLKKRFMKRLLGKDVDMTPVGATTTYGMIELMKKCGTDFLAPGCGVAPQTPLENILQLQKARNDYFLKTG